MTDYSYVLSSTVAEAILSLSARHRAEFTQMFRALANDSFCKGEQSFKDSIGREVQKRKFGNWLVSYWTDHAVREVRIVGIQKTRP